MNDKKIILFANPHSHHAYFTLLALSQAGYVLLICPPLQLQFLRKQWSRKGVRFYRSKPLTRLYQILAIVIFLIFKAKIISELYYVSLLSSLVDAVTLHHKDLIWVHYQDYISLSPFAQSLVFKDICELIIDSDSSHENWLNTVKVASKADVVVRPIQSVASSLKVPPSKIYLAPYGGDKLSYKLGRHTSVISTKPLKLNQTQFTIAARANSYRKGLDILLDALSLLSNCRHPLSFNSINVLVCGSVDEPKGIEMLNQCVKSFNSSSLDIKITAQQYTQSEYIDILHQSDVFVMPSRLEGSSLAALEALWCGTPCILSEHCGVDAFHSEKHGLLLSSNTSKTLSETLFRLLSSPSLLTKWQEHLLNDRYMFTWGNYLESYKNILCKISE